MASVFLKEEKIYNRVTKLEFTQTKNFCKEKKDFSERSLALKGNILILETLF